jgi:hypothetical protein
VGSYLKLPSVLTDFRDSLCIRSDQADSVQQLKRLSLLNVAFFDLQLDVGCSLQGSVNDQSVLDGFQEGVASNNEQECQSQAPSDKSARCCDSCGNRLPPSKLSKKKKQGSEQLLCRHCEKVCD